mmetsp:Transcript_21813/g.70602  ORF Transcript_21813/g.70602 Transcript_21813/m.70602 type:complete len:81 (-) Transcript_21813:377-619(-)
MALPLLHQHRLRQQLLQQRPRQQKVRLRLLQPLGLGELENTLKLRGAMTQAVAAEPLVNLSMTSTNFLHISSDLLEGMST